MILRAFSTTYFLILASLLYLQWSFTPLTPEELAAPGTKTDHLARWRYELEKLKDPVTGDLPINIRKRELAFARTLPSRERLNQAQKSLSLQSIGWQFRGPENLGGRTRALAVDVTNPNVLIAGGVSGGMFRSEDGGATWTRTSKLSDLKSVTCVVQDKRPGMTHVWYYGTGEARANSAGLKTQYYGDGISKSTDGGRTWKQLDATVSSTPHRFDDLDYIMELAVDRSNLVQDEVYCATTRAVYRSTDGGINWDAVLGQSAGQGSYASVHATASGVMYATIPSQSQYAGIYRSTDGISWVNITPITLEGYERIVIASAPSDENQVYFYMSTPGRGMNGHAFWSYTYIKGNGAGEGNGAWEERTQFLPADIQSYYSYCMALEVHETKPETVYLGALSVYRSTNGFASSSGLSFITGGEFHADNHVFARVAGKPNEWYLGSDGGVFHTSNINAYEVRWTNRNQGYVTSQFYTVAIDHETDGSDFIMGGLQDNGTWISSPGSRDWKNIWGADGGFSHVMEQGTVLYASWQQGVVYRLHLNEAGVVDRWTRIDPANAWNYQFINPFAVDPNDYNNLYIAEGQNIWRSNEALYMENGSSEPTSYGWTWFRAATNQVVSALSVSRKPENILYFGTQSGQLFRLDNASETSEKPRNISTGKGLPGGYVSSISIDPYDADRVLVAYSSYNVISMVFTSDGGETWSTVAGNLEEFPDGSGAGPGVKWVATLPAKGKTWYFAGTTTGLYSTERLDGMNTVWMLEAESVIGNTVVDMIDVRHYDGFVAVGTHGNGVYSATIDIEGGPAKDVARLETSSLGLNISPNPSNTYSRIAFTLDRDCEVEIHIVDLQGNTVFTHREQMPKGMQAVRWNGLDRYNRPLTSGTYTVVLRTPFTEDRRKLVRVK